MTTQNRAPADAPAPDKSWHYRTFFALAAAVLILDQATKFWVSGPAGLPMGFYPPAGGIEVIPGVFNIVYVTNKGAAWGLLSGLGWGFIVLALAALVGIYCFRRSLELHRTVMQVFFGMITGGIVGNAIDRLRFGYVIDFLDVHLQFYRWPTFNLADSAIVVGTIGYLLWSFRQK